ncbi:Protein NUCLEAR FUSION DEFECTIVE 4 [Linum perenne]
MEIVRTKWAATVAGIWIQCVVGASYTFGIYSSVLKTSQGYDQSTLDTVSVFKDIGSNAGILSGLLYSFVTVGRRSPSSGGPWVVYAVGAIQCFVGYFMMWASVVGLIPPLPVPAMCLFMWMAAHAQTFFNTANVVTGVHNFGDYGGTIIGIMKGFLGLSGAILIQFYNVVCKDNPSRFLLLLAITPTLTSLILMLLVRNYDTISPSDKHNLNSLSAFALTTAAYLAVIILLDHVLTIPYWARTLSFLLLLFLLITSPLATALKAHRHESDVLARALLEESGAKKVSVPLLPEAESNNDHDDREQCGDHEDVNMAQALCRVDFWLLFLAVFCGLGSGVATINNISQVGESLGYTNVETNSLVSLWSIWNFLGRFGAGYMSDSLLFTGGWARPILMSATLATMAIGHIVIASGLPTCLYVGSVLVGISYGSQWSLMPTICSEIFGVAHMGTIFNTIAVASPLGSYVFSVRVIGFLYDREVAKKDGEGGGGECVGTRCFMLSFFIMACMAFFGSLVAMVLFFRTRRFYRVVVLKRLKRMQLC